jgi:hypothetical protein
MAQKSKFPFGVLASSILTAIVLGLAIAEIRADPRDPIGLMDIRTAWFLFYAGIIGFVFNSVWFSRIAKRARIARNNRLANGG